LFKGYASTSSILANSSFRRSIGTVSVFRRQTYPGGVPVPRREFSTSYSPDKSKILCKGWATSVTPQSSAYDPAEAEALRCLEQGTTKLEEGDVQGAKSLYQRSTYIKRNASSLFNLGVTHYHLSLSFYRPVDYS
jgi:hypothetical protein